MKTIDEILKEYIRQRKIRSDLSFSEKILRVEKMRMRAKSLRELRATKERNQ